MRRNDRRPRHLVNLGAAAALAALAVLTCRVFAQQVPPASTSAVGSGPSLSPAPAYAVSITEVMTSNKGAAKLPAELLPALPPTPTGGVVPAGHWQLPDNPDWIELLNQEQSANVSMKGWSLATHDGPVPLPDVTLPPGTYLLLLAGGRSAKAAAANARLVAAFDSSSAPGTLITPAPVVSPGLVVAALPYLQLPGSPSRLAALALLRPDGSTASKLGWVARQQTNVSWGVPDAAATRAAGLPAPKPGAATYLATPTPGKANAAAMRHGPLIVGATEALQPVQPLPGSPISISASVAPNLAPISQVTLVYKINFGAEQTVTMAVTKPAAPDPATGGNATYTAAIPASAFKAGDLVRWAIKAGDSVSQSSRLPETLVKGATRTELYFGAVAGGVADPDLGPNATLPVMEWFSPSPEQSMSSAGAAGSALFFQGQFFDGVEVRRRGVSSLAWKKPKLRMSLASGQQLSVPEYGLSVDNFGLQSHFFELGERSYMKDSLGLRLLNAAGVPTPRTFHMHVRLNGKFFGLFSFVESVNNDFLKRNNIPLGGPLFKSENGELSNLRWDLPEKDMHAFYELDYPRDLNTNPNIGGLGSRQRNKITGISFGYQGSEEWGNLRKLVWGLAGGGPQPRSRFVVDALDIPQVVNVMAAAVIINNQDRCTKNFFLYLNPVTNQWLFLPWDLDAALGQDNGLGGVPGDKYCVLACQQWNSPLYCDSEHTQDLQRVTPWGTVTVPLDPPFTGGAPSSGTPGGPVAVPGGRRLAAVSALQGQAAWGVGQQRPSVEQSLLVRPASYPTPRGWDNPDRNTTSQASPNSAPGSYNHLIDAMLDVPFTRAMVMRRIRTLTDTFLQPGGVLEQMANATYAAIKRVADRDAALWQTGINIDNGYRQIITEFIPVRYHTLTKLYGPGGAQPLVPGPQPSPLPPRTLALAAPSSLAGALTLPLPPPNATARPPADNMRLAYIQVTNTGPTARVTAQDASGSSNSLDLSGWGLGSALGNFVFPAGTALPANGSLIVAVDPVALRAALPGQGRFILGPFSPPTSPASPPAANKGGKKAGAGGKAGAAAAAPNDAGVTEQQASAAPRGGQPPASGAAAAVLSADPSGASRLMDSQGGLLA